VRLVGELRPRCRRRSSRRMPGPRCARAEALDRICADLDVQIGSRC
jgi:hypothetical protein